MPGEHHRDRGPASLGDRDGCVADGGFGALQAHADAGERAVRMAEAILHVHDEQRPVCHMPTSSAGQSGFNHVDKADTFAAHRSIRDADPLDYSALVLPGGVVNADELRIAPGAVTFVQRIFEAGKPAAVICHGPWALVEADLVRGRTLTSWPSLQT